METYNLFFGKHLIQNSQVFYIRKNVFAFVNLRPVSPGHVLLCPKKIVSKFEELTQIQTLDMFIAAQQICKQMQNLYQKNFVLVIQNGKQAGQTVPHLHIHIIQSQINQDLDQQQRKNRTQQQMSTQASKYRDLFQQLIK